MIPTFRYLLQLAVLCLALASAAVAQVPRMISYQGRLADASGSPVGDGLYTIRVNLYDALDGGTMLFSENHAVAVVGGVFNLIIGQINPVPTTLQFDRPYYLAVSVNNAAEMSPRTLLTAAPYALRSTVADQLAPGAPNVVTSVNGGSGALTLQGAGGTTISRTGTTVTISSSGTGGTGIQGVQNTDGSITVTNPNGPVATLALADNAVTSAKIADGSITAADLSAGAIPSPFNLPFSGNASTPSDAFEVINGGTGRAGAFTTTRATSISNTLEVTSNSAGSGIYSRMTGTGRAGFFDIVNPTSARAAVEGNTDGSGSGVAGWATATTGATRGVFGRTSSTTGSGVYGMASSTTGASRGVYGEAASSTGFGLYGNASAGGIGVFGSSATGTAGQFDLAGGGGNALEASTRGSGSAIVGTIGTGTGEALASVPAMRGDNNTGTGIAGLSGSGAGVHAFSKTGDGLFATSASRAINAQLTGGTAEAILGNSTSGVAHGVHGTVSAAAGLTAGVLGETSSAQGGTGAAVGASGVMGMTSANTPGAWSAGVRGVSSGGTSTSSGVIGFTSGAGRGVHGESSSGDGVRGISSTGNGVFASTDGTANSLWVQHDGTGTSTTGNQAATTRNLAVFNANGTNVARIDRTGKGFFNGGTQASGADLAEAFVVEGKIAAYEPGDVLVISVTSDRTVELSSAPHSTLVAGVYATRPGMLLSGRHIDEDHSDMVPMGVVGVIPTKVCGENGAIRRGDLLVTSSTPGHAMRAGENPRTGTVIGKALQSFDGSGTGRIEVLVNVK